VGTSPGEPPASPPAGAQTQIAGQQIEPSTTVPHVPGGPLYRPSTAAPTNSLAVVSLVAGIMSFFAHIIPGVGGFTVAIVAIVTGYMARQQIKQSGEQGMWMATAGIIIGILHIALIAIVVLLVLFVVFVLGIALFGASRH
jgi:hypothetical protein